MEKGPKTENESMFLKTFFVPHKKGNLSLSHTHRGYLRTNCSTCEETFEADLFVSFIYELQVKISFKVFSTAAV